MRIIIFDIRNAYHDYSCHIFCYNIGRILFDNLLENRLRDYNPDNYLNNNLINNLIKLIPKVINLFFLI
jgi:hypothetical protein